MVLIVLAMLYAGSCVGRSNDPDTASESDDTFASPVCRGQYPLLRFTLTNCFMRESPSAPETIGIYDLFGTTNKGAKIPGSDLTNWICLTNITVTNQTNIALPNLWPTMGFFRLGTIIDSDNDRLTDAFEILVSKTNRKLWDSSGNGVSDGDKLSPSGLPWHLEQVRHYAAVAFANVSTTTTRGSCGQVTVYLPNPAPTGGASVKYRTGGSILNEDYTLSSPADSLFIPKGASSGIITVCALDNNKYAEIDRYVQITLTNSTSGEVDSWPAQVNIVNTALPAVRVFALPNWVRKPSPDPSYGTNSAAFYFIRDGDVTKPGTVHFELSGTAVNGIDYLKLPTSVTFLAGAHTNLFPVMPLRNSRHNSDSTIILTLTDLADHQIDPEYGSAKMTLTAVGLPPDFFKDQK